MVILVVGFLLLFHFKTCLIYSKDEEPDLDEAAETVENGLPSEHQVIQIQVEKTDDSPESVNQSENNENTTPTKSTIALLKTTTLPFVENPLMIEKLKDGSNRNEPVTTTATTKTAGKEAN
jgi:hypothetical protein